MKRWWIWIVLLLSLGVNAGILATLATQRLRQAAPVEPPVLSAEPSPEAPRPGVMPDFFMLADRLGLSGERRDRFVEIQRNAFERMRASRQRLLAARGGLRGELAAASPDRERVDRLLEETIAAQGELERALVDSLLESRTVLDADQQRLYARFIEERLRPASQMAPRRGLRERLFERRGRRP